MREGRLPFWELLGNVLLFLECAGFRVPSALFSSCLCVSANSAVSVLDSRMDARCERPLVTVCLDPLENSS